ncbi:aldose 1-epimerase family protein [Actinoalloteichus caeruleus]|uniref:Aldose 1-epimerase n=1 Tax=Actinoalloteichus caeruleus DSM 43889 TaxID=1120930 RepID=A0ABT1JK23_ACTCY|nr:aldose 1-epimerase family protein [Actinoalloteichus caeruleus]MCP2332518.1 aldose 1-epimerase [Actinoalloteichus caeruleus DSM 43889]
MSIRPVTGTQFEIAHGSSRCVLTEVGAAIRVFEVDGRPLVETYPEDVLPPYGSGTQLVPWANRVADGRWVLDGEPQQLALTEPRRNNAIHGLTRTVSWEVRERTASSILFATTVNPQPGWPVALAATLAYALSDDGLTVTYGVENLGDRPTPFGVGAHPFPRAGHARTEDCVIRLAAETRLPVDDRLLPTGSPVPVAGTDHDFRVPRPLGATRLDTAFGGCRPGSDGLVHHQVLAQDGTGVDIWAEPVFGWVQVFTPDDYPGRGLAVAIEPVTSPPDALNSGTDLLTVAPGERWTGSWGMRPV